MNLKDRLKMKTNAQSTVEYIVLLGVIVAGLIAMQLYLKRGMQGSMRNYAGQISQGAGYSPGATESLITVRKNIEEATNTFTENRTGTDGKVSVSESSTQLNQITNSQETVLPFAAEPRRW